MDKTKWTVDESQSSIQFNADQVKGSFHSYEATVESDPGNLVAANIAFMVDLDSIDTGDKQRDALLVSEQFFDVKKFPVMRFIANNILEHEEHQYELVGDFSLHGVTRTESFFATFKGEAEDSDQQHKSSFQGSGRVKRSDYGLADQDGDKDEVEFTLHIQLTKEA